MSQRPQAAHSHLLSLPAELRLQIYGHLFANAPQARTLHIFEDRVYRWIPSRRTKASKGSILYVCRLLYLEARLPYIQSTHFSLTCWGSPLDFQDRFEELGTLQDFPLARIRKLKLTLEAGSDTDVSPLRFSLRELRYALRDCQMLESLLVDLTVAPDHVSHSRIDHLFHSLRRFRCLGQVQFDLHSWGRGRRLPAYHMLKSVCKALGAYVPRLLDIFDVMILC